MIVSNWITENGGKVEMHTEHIHKKQVNADGWKVEVDADEIVVHKVTVNGKDFGRGHRVKHNGQTMLSMGRQSVGGKMRDIYVPLKPDVIEQVWGEYDRRRKAKEVAEAKAERKYQE